MATTKKVDTIDSDTLEPVETATARREAENADIDTVKFDVEFRGRIFHLEAPADIMSASANAYIAYENNHIATMLKEILGVAQWNMLIGAGMTTRIMVETVFEAYQEAAGLGED